MLQERLTRCGVSLKLGSALLFIGLAFKIAAVPFYYLRVVVQMYFRDPASEESAISLSPADAVAIGVAAIAILFIGLFPSGLLEIARIAG